MKNSILNSLFVKLATVVSSLALLVTVSNINSVCIGIAHQPELPEEAKDLRRF